MTADEIGKAGIRLFIILFRGKPNDFECFVISKIHGYGLIKY